MTIKFRPQRSSIEESRAETVEFETIAEFISYLNKQYLHHASIQADQLEFVAFAFIPEVAAWERYLVTLTGNGIGYSDTTFAK